MANARADLGFGDALQGFNPADWSPDTVKERPNSNAARQAAEVTGFKSREVGQGAGLLPPLEAAPEIPVRRRRTGRNAQLNLKARPDTISAFCAIADQNGWGLGETLEYAVDLLEKAYLP